jgi:hypothetical protein
MRLLETDLMEQIVENFNEEAPAENPEPPQVDNETST